MTATSAMPILQVRHADEDGWSVHVTWPDGTSEKISGFKNESDANAWIADQFHDWLNERNKTRERPAHA